MDADKPTPAVAGDEPGSPTGMSKTRRKLVKGMAYVPPLLLSFRAGGAVTATSHNACLAYNKQAAQEAAQGNPNFTLSPTPDTWLRTQVVGMEARRVRKKNGVWLFKGDRVVRTYTHKPVGAYEYYSVRLNHTGRKWLYHDTGRTIQVYDPISRSVQAVGNLLYRNSNPRWRYIALHHEERYGIVAVDSEGQVLRDTDNNPVVQAIAPQEIDLQNASNSCWASLGLSTSGRRAPV